MTETIECERTISSLISKGYSLEEVQFLFQTSLRILSAVNAPNLETKCFSQMISRQYRPSPDTIQSLIADGIPTSFIESEIPSFILYWTDVGEVRPEFESRFMIHVRYNWQLWGKNND